MPPLRSIDPQRASSPPFHRSSGVISAEDRVDRLEACTASLPPEAVELDAQQEAVAAAAEEPDAQQEAVAAAEEPDAQQEAVAAAEPDAQQEAVAAA
ncbi:MAG: hypothetical protein JWQ17_1375, partial [Tardiphaga sp.]|nr:hypothetical protein [Tardiphaga sp.]